MKIGIITSLVVSLCLFGQAADVVGFWKTIDDETGEAKSIVQIYEEDGMVCGKVVKLLKNPDARAKIKGEPKIEGLQILSGLTRVKDDANSKCEGGKVLDPQKGKTYTAQIWLNKDGTLTMRGSLFGIGRKQIWQPVADYPVEIKGDDKQ